MKGMDRAARQALLPDYEIFSVDLTGGTSTSTSTSSTSTSSTSSSCAY